MKYIEALDVKKLVDEIVEDLDLFHIVPQFVYCYRSEGSKAKRVVARIHSLEKLWQEVLRKPPMYAIEVISERFDKLSEEQKEKILIHELLHIPKGFSGGFRPHKGFIDWSLIIKLHQVLVEKRSSRDRDCTNKNES